MCFPSSSPLVAVAHHAASLIEYWFWFLLGGFNSGQYIVLATSLFTKLNHSLQFVWTKTVASSLQNSTITVEGALLSLNWINDSASHRLHRRVNIRLTMKISIDEFLPYFSWTMWYCYCRAHSRNNNNIETVEKEAIVQIYLGVMQYWDTHLNRKRMEVSGIYEFLSHHIHCRNLLSLRT